MAVIPAVPDWVRGWMEKVCSPAYLCIVLILQAQCVTMSVLLMLCNLVEDFWNSRVVRCFDLDGCLWLVVCSWYLVGAQLSKSLMKEFGRKLWAYYGQRTGWYPRVLHRVVGRRRLRLRLLLFFVAGVLFVNFGNILGISMVHCLLTVVLVSRLQMLIATNATISAGWYIRGTRCGFVVWRLLMHVCHFCTVAYKSFSIPR